MLDLGRTFLQGVERRPQHLALVDGELRLTYAQRHARIRSVCGALMAPGLRRGDHLVVVKPSGTKNEVWVALSGRIEILVHRFSEGVCPRL